MRQTGFSAVLASAPYEAENASPRHCTDTLLGHLRAARPPLTSGDTYRRQQVGAWHVALGQTAPARPLAAAERATAAWRLRPFPAPLVSPKVELGYTWAPKGKQPLVKTCGKRKGYKIFGLIDYFSGRLFWRGQTERFTAERSCAVLATVLVATDRPIILVQDGACYHTAATTRAFIAAQAERLTVYQLPSYSPDYNPIEHLWRNVKRDRTHNRYFATFAELMQEVDAALTHYQTQPGAVLHLMGTCLDKLAEPTAAQAPVAQAA